MLNVTGFIVVFVIIFVLIAVVWYCVTQCVTQTTVGECTSFVFFLLFTLIYGLSVCVVYALTPVESTKLSTTLNMVSVNGNTWGSNQHVDTIGRHYTELKNEFIVYIENDDSTVSARTFSLETPLVVDGENKVYVYIDHRHSWLVHYDSERYVLHVSE